MRAAVPGRRRTGRHVRTAVTMRCEAPHFGFDPGFYGGADLIGRLAPGVDRRPDRYRDDAGTPDERVPRPELTRVHGDRDRERTGANRKPRATGLVALGGAGMRPRALRKDHDPPTPAEAVDTLL